MFYKDYIILIYPKAYLANKVHRYTKVIKVYDNEDNNSSESSKDDLFDVDD